MYNRIVDFAERTIPPLAEMAGEMIKEAGEVARNDHEWGADVIWSRFQIKHRGPACSLMEALFRPLDDWGKESVVAAAALLQDAFSAALDQTYRMGPPALCRDGQGHRQERDGAVHQGMGDGAGDRR